ncbi:hypothetical protein TNCV_701291 [Trichonephila clavipes]|nr:hypothetical protein TNCV_701291 [Trichonephila clavipes]
MISAARVIGPTRSSGLSHKILPRNSFLALHAERSQGEIIEGTTFVKREIQKVTESGYFPVEKILKGGKAVGKEALRTGTSCLSMYWSGENFQKSAARKRSEEAGRGCADITIPFTGTFERSALDFKHYDINFIGGDVEGRPTPHNP